MFEELASILNLGAFSKEEKDFISNDVEIKKRMNDFLRKCREAAKRETCFYCDKTVESFCNSHSIPKFCLRNIAHGGEVLTLNLIIDNPFMKHEKGVGAAGTFNLICRDCDSKIFSDYEDPNNYNSIPTQKMISQIALKNNLKAISKRLLEIEMYNLLETMNNDASEICQAKNYVNNLDLKEYVKGYNKAKKAIEKNSDRDYYVCYYEKLNYVVPIAFQASLALAFDFDGNIINNLYNPSQEYEIKNINISVFPLECESVIIMFIENGDKRYRSFYKQFNKLPLEDKLLALTFIMFAYSEEIYYSKSIEEAVLSSQKLCEAGVSGLDILSVVSNIDSMKVIKEKYDLNNRKKIPNLLSEEFKLK